MSERSVGTSYPAKVNPQQKAPLDLVERTAESLRDQLVTGVFGPGEQLSESALSEQLDVSRNTLRESFRILMHEGLLVRRPNRGVFVSDPSVPGILDVYRVRRLIEPPIVRAAAPKHPALARARRIVDGAVEASERDDWTAVGTANMEWHLALVSLSDSPRLIRYFRTLAAELRLSFISLNAPEYLHSAFVSRNVEIMELLDRGEMSTASDLLEEYLTQSERLVLAAFNGFQITDSGLDSGR